MEPKKAEKGEKCDNNSDKNHIHAFVLENSLNRQQNKTERFMSKMLQDNHEIE